MADVSEKIVISESSSTLAKRCFLPRPLSPIDKVKSFVNAITQFNFDFDLISGRYVIDAKSIMGIFSLDLSKPIDLNIHAENQDADNIIELLKPYLV